MCISIITLQSGRPRTLWCPKENLQIGTNRCHDLPARRPVQGIVRIVGRRRVQDDVAGVRMPRLHGVIEINEVDGARYVRLRTITISGGGSHSLIRICSSVIRSCERSTVQGGGIVMIDLRIRTPAWIRGPTLQLCRTSDSKVRPRPVISPPRDFHNIVSIVTRSLRADFSRFHCSGTQIPGNPVNWSMIRGLAEKGISGVRVKQCCEQSAAIEVELGCPSTRRRRSRKYTPLARRDDKE
jgi:hypothetical protein